VAQVRTQGCLYLPPPWSQKSRIAKLHSDLKVKGSLPLVQIIRQQSYKRMYRKTRCLSKSLKESRSQISSPLCLASTRLPPTLSSLLATKRQCISVKQKTQSQRPQLSISTFSQQPCRMNLSHTRDHLPEEMDPPLCEKSVLSTNGRGPLSSGARSGCSGSSKRSRASSGCKMRFIPRRASRSPRSGNTFAVQTISRHGQGLAIRTNLSHQSRRGQSQTSKAWKTSSARVSTPR
jgi:hypothetical protein